MRSDSFSCVRLLSIAGTRLKSRAHAITSPAAKTRANGPMCKLTNGGNGNGLSCIRAGVTSPANQAPITPPRMQSKAFSTRSWRRMRHPVAPSAARKAISRRRAMERVSSRLRIFAATITNTRPTAPINISSAGRIWPTSES
jgi:hypothetical protein